MMLTNFHSHTPRCGHAHGTEEEFVLKAIEEGFDIFGFSDHSPFPLKENEPGHIRMPVNQLPDYVNAVRSVGEKYADKIQIKLGLECEYFPNYHNWLKEKIDEFQMDYVILGNHFVLENGGYFYFGSAKTKERLYQYVDLVTEGMETGTFSYFAHPDLVLKEYPVFDDVAKDVSRALCRAAKALNCPVEYNLTGLKCAKANPRPDWLWYPCNRFWEIAAEEGCRALVGVDAHVVDHICRADAEDAAAYLRSLGLEPEWEIKLFR